MAAAVANESCDPFAASTGTCRLGNMVSYAVNVSSPAEIAQTIAYATEKNIRLVIRNTGHEYIPLPLPFPSQCNMPNRTTNTHPATWANLPAQVASRSGHTT